MINIHTYIFNSQREKIAITEEKAISIANDHQVRNNGYIDGFIHITYYNHNITSENVDWFAANDVRILGKWQRRNELFYERSDLENGKNQHKARKSNIVQYKKQAEKICI
ncbi:hypothetical protein P9858_04620 [Niallia circulans]|uniref:hypothetical protein n=1 Tax=Niallia circulans TaxID=1397 RepID=UPI002E214217|nr:hypothetical protein [Niallia circulans]